VTSTSFVGVASNGRIDRDERCPACHLPLLYRLCQGRVVGKFCGNPHCAEFAREIGEAS